MNVSCSVLYTFSTHSSQFHLKNNPKNTLNIQNPFEFYNWEYHFIDIYNQSVENHPHT
jgi:hypothetical protein